MKNILKILFWLGAGISTFVLLILLFLLLPPVQSYLTDKVSGIIENKFGIRLKIDNLYIRPPKTLSINGLYLRDQQGDTLLYAGSLHLSVDIPDLFGKTANIESLSIEKLTAGITRRPDDSVYNYQFIIDAFSPKNPGDKPPPAKPWTLKAGKITLRDIRFTLDDQRSGTFLSAVLKKGDIDTRKMNLAQKEIHFNGIALSGFNGLLLLNQKKNHSRDDSTKTAAASGKDHTPGLLLSTRHLKLKDIRFVMNRPGDDFYLDSGLDYFTSVNPKITLGTMQIDIDAVDAGKLRGKIEINKKNESLSSGDTSETGKEVPSGDKKIGEHLFGDFDLSIHLGSAKIRDSEFSLEYPGFPRMTTVDYHHLDLININAGLQNANFHNDGVSGTINKLAVHDRSSGFILNNLQAGVKFTGSGAGLKGLIIQTPHSSITGDFSFKYPSVNIIKTHPQRVDLDITAKASPLGIPDLDYFVQNPPEIPENPSDSSGLNLKLKCHGQLNDFNIGRFTLTTGRNTKVEASGTLKGLPDLENMAVDLRLDTMYTTLKTIWSFTGSDSLPGRVSPDDLLKGKAFITGSLDSARFDLQLSTDKGFLKMHAGLKKNTGRYHISSQANFSRLQAGVLTGINDLGTASGSLDAHLVADSTGLISSGVSLLIDSVLYNDHPYRNIHTNLNSSGSQYHFNSTLESPKISYNLKASALKTSDETRVNLDLQIKTLDLLALNFVNRGIILSGTVHSSIDYRSTNDFQGSIDLENFLVKSGEMRYPIKKIRFESRVDSTFNFYQMDSEILYAKLTGNVKLTVIRDLLINHLNAYIIGHRKEYVTSPYFDMELKLYNPEILTEIVFPKLETFSLKSFIVHYDDSSRLLSADILIPTLEYGNIRLDTLRFDLNSTEKKLKSTLFLNRFLYDSLTFDSLNWNIVTKGKQIFSRLTIGDTLRQKYDLGMRLDLEDSMRVLSFIPDQLLANHIRWTIPENNRITVRDSVINTEAVTLESTAGQFAMEGRNSDMILTFKEFDLHNLTAIFNNPGLDHMLAGKISGRLQIKNVFSSSLLDADLQITQIHSMGADLGRLTVALKQPADSLMNFDIRLTGPGNTLTSLGTLEQGPEDPGVDIKTTWEFKKPEVFQPWAAEYIKNVAGTISGNLTISGTRAFPVPAGTIRFKQFNVELAKTNTWVGLRDEVINMNDNGLHLGNVHLYDSLGNQMSLRGDLFTTDYKSFRFDLALNTNKFQLVNNKKTDLESLYGRLMIATDIKLTGNNRFPVIDANLNILGKTAITYAMTGSDLTLQSDEGIVVYSNRELSPDSMMVLKKKKSVADSLAQKISGLNLDARISIDKNAQFTLVTNPTAGDYATFKMSGNLNYRYRPSQLGNLTGKVTLEEGNYELSFYGLIHKKFTLIPGSYISWSGNVMDGNIHFEAKYIVRSNSVGLVGAEVTEAEKANYNQKLPYEVILNVTGLLSDPQIRFNIDLPKNYRSGQPLIDSKLQSLNQDGMENERNRQALALLVGGTFIPESSAESTDQEIGFATTAAMNTMNSIITQQLNNLSGMFIKDMEVNMGINKIENYGGTTTANNTRTQLDIGVNKYFMENRILIGVEGHIDLDGSNPTTQNNTSTMTEFIVQYLLTKNGNYRIKAFRENAFDLIDGEIQNTGLAFIFVIDFGQQNAKKDKNNQRK